MIVYKHILTLQDLLTLANFRTFNSSSGNFSQHPLLFNNNNNSNNLCRYKCMRFASTMLQHGVFIIISNARRTDDRRGGVPFFVPSAQPPQSRHCCTNIILLLYTRSAPQTNNYVSNIIRINYYRVQKGDFRITPVYKII